MEEKWKDIQGYEGIYKISNCGRIKSAYGYIWKYVDERSNTDV